jgi:hypothetical protein
LLYTSLLFSWQGTKRIGYDFCGSFKQIVAVCAFSFKSKAPSMCTRIFSPLHSKKVIAVGAFIQDALLALPVVDAD